MPFNQFNSMSGRFKRSNQLLPLYPIAPVPLESSSEPPRMMFEPVKTKPVHAAAASTSAPTHASTSAPASASSSAKPTLSSVDTQGFAKHLSPEKIAFMKKLQSDLQAPVFLARGTPDKILFGITVAMIGYGMFESTRFLWLRANGKI